MKTKLLKDLLKKAINTLDLIEQAEKKRDYYVELMTKHLMTTWKNELSIWPCGRPTAGELSKEYCGCQIDWYNQKVLPRLEKRYAALLDKITCYAVDDELAAK